MSAGEARELPVPEFYRPASAGEWAYRPAIRELAAAAGAWRDAHAIAPAAADERRVELLLVDVQRDFCHPEGALFVGGRSGRGAIDDSDRLARFVYRHLATITGITATLDTHVPFQIFSPEFWVDRAGAPLAPNREVAAEEVEAGDLRPAPGLAAWLAPGGDEAWLARQAAAYCRALEEGGRYRLFLWPAHCLLGSQGHALVGAVDEARLFHAWARSSPGRLEPKGMNPLTESYSAIGPEVLASFDGRPLGRRNLDLVERLLAADTVIVAGQAASHCVRSTLEDLVAAARAQGGDATGRIWILTDCMSAVAVPDPGRPGELLFDFTPQAEAALVEFAEAGCRLIRSDEPLPRDATGSRGR